MIDNKHILPCVIMRGGTSKGLFFMEKDLPAEGEERDKLLLKVMGSPDKKQIDGLGGAASVTSKVAIIAVSEREDADINYTFAQVSVDKPIVSYKGNCGNISSAVGPFAIEKGLVAIKEPVTSVRIFNTNTNKIIISDVQIENGKVKYSGDFSIAGVPGTAAPIKLKFDNPAGTISDRLLTTGNITDELDIPDYGKLNVSFVDAANPLVFVKATDLGLVGTELPDSIDSDPDLLDLLEKVRGVAAVKIGLIDDYKESAWKTPGIPKLTIVSEPQSYVTTNGKQIESDQIDIVSKMMSMQKTHPTYALTGAMCTVAAAVLPGSVVNQLLAKNADFEFIRIGNPGGIMEAGVDFEVSDDGLVQIDSTFGFRTANFLLEGFIHC